MKYALSESDVSNVEKKREHFDAKTKDDNDFAALDYMIDGNPISEELYHNAIRQPVIDMLEINEDCDVLDIGCGTGLMLSQIEDRCRKVIGTDLSETLLSRYKGKAETFVAAAHEVEYPPESFDRIYMVSVSILFPSFDYFKNVVERCLSMLRPDGIFVISDQIYRPNPCRPVICVSTSTN